MDRNAAIKIARRRIGIAKFERECRIAVELSRAKKAWRVPGTQEAGKHAMLQRMVWDEAARLERGEPGIHG